MRKQMGIGITILISMALFLSGCEGRVTETVGSEDIVLLEPVAVGSNTQPAAYRNLYNAKIYSASVYPDIREYAYEESRQFVAYGAYPGQYVEKGAALIYTETKTIDEQIKAMEEKLTSMQQEYDEYKSELLEELMETRGEEKNLADIVKNLKQEAPEQSGASGTVSGADVGNPEYIKWQEEYHSYYGKYQIQEHNNNRKEVELAQRTQLFELDYSYNSSCLERMHRAREEASLNAGMQGNVVAVAELSYNQTIPGERSVVAVGDLDQKLVKCEYLNKSLVTGAEDIYALIDGRRYEVSYQPMSAEEYEKESRVSDKVYSTFLLEESQDLDEVEVGDFGVIVLLSDRRSQVLTVPKEAIHKDGTGYYVYVQQEGQNVITTVRTGMSDGVYTEILSGLAEGDRVLLSTPQTEKTKTAELERGSFHSSFRESGFLYYPETQLVINEVSHGTMYFQEYAVSMYQHVEKGDLIAWVRVKTDAIALERQKQNLNRLVERVADLREKGEEENRKAIASMEEEMEEVQSLLQEMQDDFAVVGIYAPRSGIIIGIREYETEDILKKDAGLVEIAQEDNCYVIVENTNQLLNYGNQVTISYQNREGVACQTGGTVANVSNAGVSNSLRSEYSLIHLPAEVVGDMSAATQGENGWWNRVRFEVNATIREMENVLLVPKKAVQEVAGQTYVTVKEPSGEQRAVSFLAGGYDTDYYWVIDGLTEGMEVCLE